MPVEVQLSLLSNSSLTVLGSWHFVEGEGVSHSANTESRIMVDDAHA